MVRYRVRFASGGEASTNPVEQRLPSATTEDATHSQQRSRFGCRQCRNRKVKCDETFPICQRCERRGSLCQPAPRPSQWQAEVPWLTSKKLGQPVLQRVPLPLADSRNVNARLMRYWLECVSQIMSVDQNNNPLSFPILKYISEAPSLVHVLQGVSAAHEAYFQPRNMSTSLEERSKALSAFRGELQTQSASLSHSFLTLILLGMSSSWMATRPDDFGREHLLAATTVAKVIVERGDPNTDELDHLSMGLYVYWDMACAFCLDPSDHPLVQENALLAYVTGASRRVHTTTSHSIDLYYFLSQIGRYCRSVAGGANRDFLFEIHIERELCNYESMETKRPAQLLAEAFRKHGLLLLYRLCGTPGDDISSATTTNEKSESIRQLALDIIRLILQTEPDSPYLILQVIPLLSAGAEMTALDVQERTEVKKRLHAVYSTNRLLPTLWTISLLDELWVINDAGLTDVTWLKLMLLKGWRLRIG
ncbi:hypothetical protein N7541_005030 [Penicillium brevicompactum]|uniref:Zn(2)-C6 fungal-type domain-containing protein n=1 Tax=Penicillium brevicompactum TaxID=5074 RepID=A0A9W9RD97_PENBR|nr:hypothetical protein N7541_005030 [Penicillium brevicompactum]